MVVAWVLFPLVMLAVCVGCGLAVERIAGWHLPGGLLPALGLAVVIVVSTLTTSNGTTPLLTTPLVVVIALVGYASSWPRVRAIRPDGWALAVGLGVFAVCAAPLVASGNASFLGYFVLSDFAVHFVIADQLLAHGRGWSGLPPSAVTSLLQAYLPSGYPVGADVALGALRPLVGQDVAWIFQPYLATILAFGGVSLYELLAGVVRSRPLRALCAFAAAQTGLVYGFYLESSVKELVTATIVSATVALVAATLRRTVRLRTVLPLVIVAVAGLDVLEVPAIPWLGVPLAVFVLIAGWRGRARVRRMPWWRLAALTAGSAAVLALLLAPLIGSASTFFNTVTGVLGQPSDIGNLAGPLLKWQLLGIWPSGDFRLPVITHYRVAYALMGIAVASAVLGTLWMIRRRAFAPLLLLVSGGIATVYLLGRSSPYAAAKTLTIYSSAVTLSAMLGAAALHDVGRRIEAWVLAAVIAGGVLWTNALAYHHASIAPRNRFAELAYIGNRFAGQGPTFYNLWDTGAVHFLRREAPTVPNTWSPPPPLAPGVQARAGDQARLAWDTNDIALSYLESYRLLVLGRSPVASRPPANFKLAYQGAFYSVWRRTSTPDVLVHVPVGGGLDRAGVANCQEIKQLGKTAARTGARLAYVPRSPLPALIPTQASRPADWAPSGVTQAVDPYSVEISPEDGSVTGSVRIAQPGRYQVWLELSASQRLLISVGGRLVGSTASDLASPGQYVKVGDVTLSAGAQPVVIKSSIRKLEPGYVLPGNDGTGEILGPLVLVPDGADPKMSEIAPENARQLCGQSLNWVEIVR